MNTDMKPKGPGQGGQGQRGGGFSFGDGKGGGRGDRDGRRGGGRDRREGGGGASYRVVNELSGVEKALGKADFPAMKVPLAEVLKALRGLRLQSLEQLDLNTRGKLITTLMRVMRLPRPKDAAPAEAAAPEAAPVEAAPAEAPPAEAAAAEAAAAEAPATGAAPAEGGEAAAAPAAPAAPPPAPVDPAQPWKDTQFAIGLIWRSVNDADRAATAFENAGRQPSEAELATPAGAAPERAASPRGERPDRGPRRERGERPPRPERGERRERGPRPERPEPFTPSGDWQADAAKLEQLGRTRDAGRLHEKNASFPDAVRLYQAGGDLKAALRTAALGKLDAELAALSAKLKPEEVIEALERAEAWEKLMELHVARQDFEAIAKLYERALQFDQAALAWERAQKYALARKAYERAKDYGAANRMRELEVQKLIERGDRLGAATLLMTVGKKTEALEALKQLPGPKAFSFMQKLKLGAEATAFGKEELAKAEAAGNGLSRARWLELLGDAKGAVEAYLGLGRKDKAALVHADQGEWKQAAELMEAAGQLDKAADFFTKAGDVASAERVKALPRPAPAPAPAAPEASGSPAPEAEATPPAGEAAPASDVQNLA